MRANSVTRLSPRFNKSNRISRGRKSKKLNDSGAEGRNRTGTGGLVPQDFKSYTRFPRGLKILQVFKELQPLSSIRAMCAGSQFGGSFAPFVTRLSPILSLLEFTLLCLSCLYIGGILDAVWGAW